MKEFWEKYKAEIVLAVLVLYTIKSSSDPIHGYSIINRIREVSSCSINIQAGTVYPILRNLEGLGLIEHDTERSIRGPERKVYSLTDDGFAVIDRFDSLLDTFFNTVMILRMERDFKTAPSS